jgi:hypothetical protein
MKYIVKNFLPGKVCEIEMYAENDLDKDLLTFKNERDKASKKDAIFTHYQAAIEQKVGNRVHIIGLTEDKKYPHKADVSYNIK